MLTVLIFLVVISVLVFVHELGHFWTAKRAGMRVEEFGFGFPPRLVGIKRGETIYSINWVPFGGFVKILGEDGSERGNPRSFAAKPAGIRAVVIVAGVAMNLLLALVLLAAGNAVGLRQALDEKLAVQAADRQVQVVAVAANSPAQQAGLQPLDEFTGYQNVEQVQEFINANRGREVALAIRRAGETQTIKVTPRANPPPGEGALGISLALTGVVKYPWQQAISKSFQDTYYLTRETGKAYVRIIGNLFRTGQAGVELSGPVGIAVVTGQAARTGFAYLIQLVALISINLAVLNIIPFPALDGGRLLFIGLEKLKGSPVSKRVEAAVNAAGFALLILLMFYVTIKDVVKFF